MCTPAAQQFGPEPPAFIRGIDNEISPYIRVARQKATYTTGMGNRTEKRTVTIDPETGKAVDSDFANRSGAKLTPTGNVFFIQQPNPAWAAEAERRMAAHQAEQQKQQAALTVPPPTAVSEQRPVTRGAPQPSFSSATRGATGSSSSSRGSLGLPSARGGRSSLIIDLSGVARGGGVGLQIPS